MSCPLLFPPVNTGSPPAAGRRISVPPKAAIVHAHLERNVASSGEPLYRRKVSPLLRVKKKRASAEVFAKKHR